MWISVQDGEPRGASYGPITQRLTIGRDPSCEIVVDDERASGRHAVLEPGPDGFVVTDQGSTNGTFVDEQRLIAPRRVRGGERLRVGRTTLLLSAQDPAGAGDTPSTVVGPAAPPPATPITPPASAPAPPPPREPTPSPEPLAQPRPSVVERVRLARSVKRATTLAIVAGAIAIVGVAVAILAVTGVIGGGGGDDTPTVAQIARRAAPSVVLVVERQDGRDAGNGTGWVLDAGKGLVVTNNHVVQGADELRVGLGASTAQKGAMTTSRATLVATAPCEDIALIKVSNTDGLRTTPIAPSGSVSPGDTAVALGFPFSASAASSLVVTAGNVSVPQLRFDALKAQAADVPDLPETVQTSAPINPGNSGGPLLDGKGRLVGMNFAGITSAGGRAIQGQGYAIGAQRILSVLQTLKQGRSIDYAGFDLQYVTASALSARGLPQGILVDRVASGSAAAKDSAFSDLPVLLRAIGGRAVGLTLRGYCNALKAAGGDRASVDVVTSAGAATTRLSFG